MRWSSHLGSAIHPDSVPDCKTASRKSGFARGALPANDSPIATCVPVTIHNQKHFSSGLPRQAQETTKEIQNTRAVKR